MAEQMTGIDELRMCVDALNGCREDFLAAVRDPFSAEDLLKIWRAWRASEWDFYPDQWTPRQVREALRGIAPRWDKDTEKPVYG
jgi:hypothetical protein